MDAPPLAGLAVATVVAKNYLAAARVLARSLAAHHPEVPCYVLLADAVDGHFDPDAEPFRFLSLEAVAGPDADRLDGGEGPQPLAVRLKPLLLAHLLDAGFSRVLFLDPDVLVLHRLDALFAEVGRHAVTLTPHLLAPLAGPDRAERELHILRCGTLNGGLVGVSASPEARAFLAWWRARLLARCEHDVAQGVFFDQRWLDLAPALFPGVHVLRDPAYNVAYWNLPERGVTVEGEAVCVHGAPCGFFHFSGFEPEHPEAVTRHDPRLTLGAVGAAAPLFRRYAAMLAAEGHATTRHWPYAFGRTGDAPARPGRPVPAPSLPLLARLRRLVRGVERPG